MPEELENANSQNGEEQTSNEETQEEEQPQKNSEESEESTESTDSQSSDELTEREKQFLARAKKAESKLKEQKEEDKSNEQSADYLSRDEAILIAKGIDEERLNTLKRLQAADYSQTGKQKPLTDFQEDQVYKAVDAKLQEEEKKQKAQVTSNRGGGSSPADEIKPDMSEEEHRKIWEKNQR